MTQTQLPAEVPRRTDDEIRAAVLDELAWAPGTGVAGVDVAVAGGVVTLSGEVDTYPERLRAGQAAQRVHGVVGLAQEITARGRWDSTTDADIARHTGEALRRAVNVPDAVKVAVHDHVVTGYPGVDNELSINPTPAMLFGDAKAEVGALLAGLHAYVP